MEAGYFSPSRRCAEEVGPDKTLWRSKPSFGDHTEPAQRSAGKSLKAEPLVFERQIYWWMDATRHAPKHIWASAELRQRIANQNALQWANGRTSRLVAPCVHVLIAECGKCGPCGPGGGSFGGFKPNLPFVDQGNTGTSIC
jgi:hypothetical protein